MVTEAMTHRERLLATLRFQPVDRVPDFELGPWEQTMARWRREGLQAGSESPWEAYRRCFPTDSDEYGPGLSIEVGPLPGFAHTVLEDRGTHNIVQDEYGAIAEELKPELGASIPRYIRFCIESRADWERLRDERLDPNAPGRVPADLNQVVERLRDADYPTVVGRPSLYGWLRCWTGVERLSVWLYDDRPLVEEILEHLTRLTLSVMEKLAAASARVDACDWWEDMCYNHGPLISPRLFAELMVPRYKRITDFMRRELGTEFQQLDSDGNIHELVPLWLEGGINTLYPLEMAHTDAHRLAAQYGQRLRLMGGYDKRALAAGPAAIDAEFERLRLLLQRGGFIPHIDHMVPPDVSLENYIYYRRKKCEFIGKPWPVD